MTINKKVLLFGSIILLALVITVGALCFPPKSRSGIPLLDRASFGMSPTEAMIAYGRPIHKRHNNGDGGATVSYEYDMEIDGQPADVVLTFVSSGLIKRLSSASIRFSALNAEEVEQQYEDMIALFRNTYQGSAGYSATSSENCYTIYLSKGAEGTRYSIERSESFVLIRCDASF